MGGDDCGPVWSISRCACVRACVMYMHVCMCSVCMCVCAYRMVVVYFLHLCDFLITDQSSSQVIVCVCGCVKLRGPLLGFPLDKQLVPSPIACLGLELLLQQSLSTELPFVVGIKQQESSEGVSCLRN